MTLVEALGKGAGNMGMLLTALIVFHFWSWYGMAAYVVFMVVIGLVASAAKAGK